MTQQNSPDGTPQYQTPPQTLPQSSGETPNPVRDWSAVEKIIEQRDELKSTLRQVLADMAELKASLQKPAEPPPPVVPRDQADLLSERLQALESERTAEARARSRAAIETTVVSAALPEQRDLIKGQLALLAYDGKVDLSGDANAESARALEALRSRYPGAFARLGTAAPAPTGSHSLLPPGVKLHQLTAEQLAKIPQEEFAKLYKASRTSGLVV